MNTIHPARFQPHAFFKPRPGWQAGAKTTQVHHNCFDNAAVQVQYCGLSTMFGLVYEGILSYVNKIVCFALKMTGGTKKTTALHEPVSSSSELLQPAKCPGAEKAMPMSKQGGRFADKGKPHVQQGWVVPPQIYGNTAGTGIYISSSLEQMVQSLLQETMVRRLFEIAKKKGLVSITEEPGLLRGNIPVDADQVRNLRSGESRIRLSDAGNKYNIVSLVHELVHAATPDNPNSQTEEWFAENIGRRVYARQTGDQSLKMLAFTSVKNLYAHLPMDNNFKKSLEMLLPGIGVGWP